MTQSKQNTYAARHPEARFAFIKAGWHSEIVDQALVGFRQEMERRGFAKGQIDVFDVPGAFEVPLMAKKLARSGRYVGVVGAALIVNGGIYRHEFVAETVVKALMDIQLDTEVPMISVLLTPLNFHEHEEHRAFFETHFVKKGVEAAAACANTVEGLANVSAMLTSRRQQTVDA